MDLFFNSVIGRVFSLFVPLGYAKEQNIKIFSPFCHKADFLS